MDSNTRNNITDLKKAPIAVMFFKNQHIKYTWKPVSKQDSCSSITGGVWTERLSQHSD